MVFWPTLFDTQLLGLGTREERQKQQHTEEIDTCVKEIHSDIDVNQALQIESINKHKLWKFSAFLAANHSFSDSFFYFGFNYWQYKEK